MNTKNRVAYFDNCKFILIALVVLGHFLDQYTGGKELYRSLFLFIYSFHMPLFFFLSGLFDSRKPDLSKRAGKAVYYISLYILLKAVITAIRWAFTGKASFDLLSEVGIPWFCLVIGVFVILTGLLFKANVNIKVFLVINIILACFAGFDRNIGDYLCLSRMIVFYPFYLLGTAVSRDKLEALTRKVYLRIIGFIVFAAYLAICIYFVSDMYILRHLFAGRNAFRDEIRALGPLYRLLCYSITGVVGFSFLLIVPHMSLGKLTDFGRRTMQVYFWHRPVLYVLMYLDVHKYIMSVNGFGSALWILSAFVLTLILSMKIFGFPTEQLGRWMTGKKLIDMKHSR